MSPLRVTRADLRARLQHLELQAKALEDRIQQLLFPDATPEDRLKVGIFMFLLRWTIAHVLGFVE